MLLILDEIMCGMGRTGKLHAWSWEGKLPHSSAPAWLFTATPSNAHCRPTGVTPDIQTIGKGLNGGYQALSAVLISERVVEGLKKGSGAFANGERPKPRCSAY